MKGFLTAFKHGPKGETVYAPMANGFLRLVYEDDGLIYQAAFVRERGAEPNNNQLQLYFVWVNHVVTFKTENSLGGRQWSGGNVYSGTTLETDDDGPVPPDTTTGLEVWVDDCVNEMARKASAG